MSQLKGSQTGGAPTYSREDEPLVLLRPSTDWVRPTHLGTGNLLISKGSSHPIYPHRNPPPQNHADHMSWTPHDPAKLTLKSTITAAKSPSGGSAAEDLLTQTCRPGFAELLFGTSPNVRQYKKLLGRFLMNWHLEEAGSPIKPSPPGVFARLSKLKYNTPS